VTPVPVMVAIEVPQREQQAAVAADRFTREYGTDPAGVWWAPGRVNLIGEHVDYHEGLCLPVALPIGTAVALRLRTDGVIRLGSGQRPQVWSGHLDRVGVDPVPDWAGYVAGVGWALRQVGHDIRGFDAWVEGAVPLGAGLSSSAALECAVAVALADLLGLRGAAAADEAGRIALAAACVRAENEIAGANTGGLDQAVSLRARAGHAMLLDCRDFTARQIPLDTPLAEAGLELVIVDTQAHHTLVDGQYGQRRELSMTAARRLGLRVLRDLDPADLPDALRRLRHDDERAAVRHVVTEIQRVSQAAEALGDGRPAGLGPLMTGSHVSLRDDYRVSCPELDAVVDQALATGALGARMTGGGFGGSAIALCPPRVTPDLLQEVSEAFVGHGWTPPRVLRVTSSAIPAGRVS